MRVARRTALAVSLSGLALLAGPAATAPAHAQTPPSTFAVEFRAGPNWDASQPANAQRFFAEHSANLATLRADGRILVGGRYGEVGLLVLKADSLEQARSLVERDASVKHGVFAAQVHPWSTFMSGCLEKPAPVPGRQ